MTKILIFIIKIYRYFISPLLGNRCRFLPTCSEYFIEALKTQGLLRGLKLGSKRILKCHPIKSLGGSEGLGSYMIYSNARLQIDNMFAALLILIIITICLYHLIDKLLKKCIWWE